MASEQSSLAVTFTDETFQINTMGTARIKGKSTSAVPENIKKSFIEKFIRDVAELHTLEISDDGEIISEIDAEFADELEQELYSALCSSIKEKMRLLIKEYRDIKFPPNEADSESELDDPEVDRRENSDKLWHKWSKINEYHAYQSVTLKILAEHGFADDVEKMTNMFNWFHDDVNSLICQLVGDSFTSQYIDLYEKCSGSTITMPNGGDDQTTDVPEIPVVTETPVVPETPVVSETPITQGLRLPSLSEDDLRRLELFERTLRAAESLPKGKKTVKKSLVKKS